VVEGTSIAALGRWNSLRRQVSGAGRAPKIINLGDAILLPGFVNCHTHLELTDLEGKIPPQESFGRWLGQLVARTLRWGKHKFTRSAARGLKLSLASGTTLLGDVSHFGYHSNGLKNSPLRKILFLEAIDFNPATAAKTAAELKRKLLAMKKIADDETKTADGGRQTADFLLGLAPHSPYTVSGALYQKCLKMAGRLALPMTTHLAETEEEREFLVRGTGDFAHRLSAIRAIRTGRQARILGSSKPVWPETPGASPVQYMHSLGCLDFPLVIAHGNFLDEEDMALLEGSSASVIYCPSSHKYFGHPPHPFPALLERGVNVALGTDSLASGQNLNMLDEMKIVARDYKEISPESILKMATIRGAKALGLDHKVGTLEVGKEADLVAFALPNSSRPLEELLSHEGNPIFTMIGGEIIYARN
jgi:cytosine/adenosine deaminase-related metal-dependent hydrolase